MHRYIRPAVSEDIPRLLTLEYQLFDNAMNDDMLVRELEVGRGLVCVTDESYVIGYALIRQEGQLLDLTRLGVDQLMQARGIGKRLLQRVLSEGLTTVLTVRKDNKHALRLYRDHGFRIVGHVSGAWALCREAARAAGPEPS